MDKKRPAPSPYWKPLPAACALTGVILFIFATFGPPASSSGFVSTLKGFFQTVNPDYVLARDHYRMIPGPGSWLMTFVVGMAIGGFLGGRTMRREVPDIPKIWQERFGPNKWKRYGATFLGGFLILFASRMAGGCTLGLFMSGTIQMSLSGIYFGALIFLTAMLTARLVYGKSAGRRKSDD